MVATCADTASAFAGESASLIEITVTGQATSASRNRLCGAAQPHSKQAKSGVRFASAQEVFSYNFTSISRNNLFAYAETGGAIPDAPPSIHLHLAHTGGGLERPKPFFDYNAGITAKCRSLAVDAAIVGGSMDRSDFARRGMSSGEAPEAGVPQVRLAPLPPGFSASRSRSS